MSQISPLPGGEVALFEAPDGQIRLDVRLDRDSVCANFAHTAEDGKTYSVRHFNLDVVISVGYRVKSLRDTQFRIWATRMLRDHLVQGYTLNERRLREKGLVAEVDRRLSLIRETEAQVDANLKRTERLHQSTLKTAFTGLLVPQVR